MKKKHYIIITALAAICVFLIVVLSINSKYNKIDKAIAENVCVKAQIYDIAYGEDYGVVTLICEFENNSDYMLSSIFSASKSDDTISIKRAPIEEGQIIYKHGDKVKFQRKIYFDKNIDESEIKDIISNNSIEFDFNIYVNKDKPEDVDIVNSWYHRGKITAEIVKNELPTENVDNVYCWDENGAPIITQADD